MIIDGREFPGQALRQGMYIPLGRVSLWEEIQYVTTNPIEKVLEPGYFNMLWQLVTPPDKIEVASFTEDGWRYTTLLVCDNTFDPLIAGVGGTISVRLLAGDEEVIPEPGIGLRSVHKGRGVYEVRNGVDAVVAEGLTREEAQARVMDGPVGGVS